MLPHDVIQNPENVTWISMHHWNSARRFRSEYNVACGVCRVCQVTDIAPFYDHPNGLVGKCPTQLSGTRAKISEVPYISLQSTTAEHDPNIPQLTVDSFLHEFVMVHDQWVLRLCGLTNTCIRCQWSSPANVTNQWVLVCVPSPRGPLGALPITIHISRHL